MVTVTDGLQYNLNTVGAGTIMKEQLRSPVVHIDILLELATDTKEVHLLMLSLEVADHVVFINEGDDQPQRANGKLKACLESHRELRRARAAVAGA